MPIPDPIHMLVTNTLSFLCLAMLKPVATWRAPAAGSKMSLVEGENLRIHTASERVSNSYGATVHIHLVEWNANLLDRVNGLRRKGLVDFVKVNVVLSQTSLLQNLWNCVGRTHAHDPRRNTNRTGCDIFAKDGKSKAFSDRSTS